MKSVFTSRRNKSPHNNEETKKQEAPFFGKESKTPFFNTPTGGTVQPKLTVGQPGDKYEKEADSMADAVVSKSSKPDIQNKQISSIQRESLATPQEDEKLGTAEQRMEEDKLVQEKPELQRMGGEEEEEGMVSKMEGSEEEEEALQTKSNNSKTTASSGLTQQIKSKTGKGKPMAKNTRSEMESSFGRDFSGVNIHTDQDAVKMNKKLGAQAFTHGKDIYFNSGNYSPDSSEGKHLLAHELTHTIQQQTEVKRKPEIQLREATWLERRAWLSFFDHYIPRMFLNNYMDDTGTTITLTEQQMRDCNPVVDVTRSPAIQAEIQRLAGLGGGSSTISTTGWGGAMTNGSLGNFTIHYNGTIRVAADGSWSFSGTMRFTDIWDFDPKPFGSSGRSTAGELKTRVAAGFLPGRAFNIDSETVSISQTNSQRLAAWGTGFVPVSVGDNAGRTAADIDVGAGAGVGAAGAAGLDVGGELGAQSSEDLN